MKFKKKCKFCGHEFETNYKKQLYCTAHKDHSNNGNYLDYSTKFEIPAEDREKWRIVFKDRYSFWDTDNYFIGCEKFFKGMTFKDFIDLWKFKTETVMHLYHEITKYSKKAEV